MDEDRSPRVLTNYEMISVGWRLMGELAPILAYIPNLEITADENEKRLYIKLNQK